MKRDTKRKDLTRIGEAVSGISDEYILSAALPEEASATGGKKTERTRIGLWTRMNNNGWVVAALSLLVAFGVVAMIIRAGREDGPEVKPPVAGTGAELSAGDTAETSAETVAQSVTETAGEGATETAAETAAETVAETTAQTVEEAVLLEDDGHGRTLLWRVCGCEGDVVVRAADGRETVVRHLRWQPDRQDLVTWEDLKAVGVQYGAYGHEYWQMGQSNALDILLGKLGWPAEIHKDTTSLWNLACRYHTEVGDVDIEIGWPMTYLTTEDGRQIPRPKDVVENPMTVVGVPMGVSRPLTYADFESLDAEIPFWEMYARLGLPSVSVGSGIVRDFYFGVDGSYFLRSGGLDPHDGAVPPQVVERLEDPVLIVRTEAQGVWPSYDIYMDAKGRLYAVTDDGVGYRRMHDLWYRILLPGGWPEALEIPREVLEGIQPGMTLRDIYEVVGVAMGWPFTFDTCLVEDEKFVFRVIFDAAEDEVGDYLVVKTTEFLRQP